MGDHEVGDMDNGFKESTKEEIKTTLVDYIKYGKLLLEYPGIGNKLLNKYGLPHSKLEIKFLEPKEKIEFNEFISLGEMISQFPKEWIITDKDLFFGIYSESRIYKNKKMNELFMQLNTCLPKDFLEIDIWNFIHNKKFEENTPIYKACNPKGKYSIRVDYKEKPLIVDINYKEMFYPINVL